jgi:hypothetical protein
MHTNVDPRAWNLLAGVALASAACGSRVAGEEAAEGETGNPECVNNQDCPVGYGCYDGVCMYYPHPDGWIPPFDCYTDNDCDNFYICEDPGYCTALGWPAPSCAESGMEWPGPTTIEVSGALELTFADVDADGQDELVVATESSLYVFESAGGSPILSDRQNVPSALVAGYFNDLPGEDVMELLGSVLAIHGSVGDGTFNSWSPSQTEIGLINGLFAGEFDDQPPTDLLAWGGAGAYIEVNDVVTVLDEQQLAAAAVHELGSPEPGIALRHDTVIDLYTLDAQPLTSWTDIGGPPLVVAFYREFESEYVTLLHYDDWTRVQSRNLDQGFEEWTMYGTPDLVFAGDLDGNDHDELVYFDELTATVEFNPGTDFDCLQGPLFVPGRGAPIDAAFGDHDGDGDQELAFRTTNGEVALFDGG